MKSTLPKALVTSLFLLINYLVSAQSANKPTIIIYDFNNDSIFHTPRGFSYPVSFIGVDIQFQGSGESDCSSILKILPQDVILQKDTTILRTQSTFTYGPLNLLHATFDIPLNASPGDYQLKILGDNLNCKIPISFHRITIYCDSLNSPLPVIEVPPSACIGNPVTFQVKNDPKMKYSWGSAWVDTVSTTRNLATFKSDTVDYFTVTLKRESACGKFLPVDAFYSYKTPPRSSAYLIGANEICKGTTGRYINLRNNSETNEIIWSLLNNSGNIVKNGKDTVDILFNGAPGNDIVIFREKNECGTGPALGSFPVTIGTAPLKPKILYKTIIVSCTSIPDCHDFKPYLLISSVVNAKSYKWFRNGIEIAGATDSVYLFQHKTTNVRELDGNYQLEIVTDCGTSRSENYPVYYFTVGLGANEEQTLQDIQIVPNPATDKITISHFQETATSYSIYNNAGDLAKLISGTQYSENNGISLEDLSNGLYFLEICNKNSRTRKKFIVTK